MAKILRAAYASKHKRRGRNSKLCVEDMLMMSCKYWREYVTFFSLGNEYEVAESTSWEIVTWVENVLIKSGEFGLPGKKTVDWRGAGSHIGRRDGESSAASEKKQTAEQKTDKKPQKRPKNMVFEKEKVSHAKKPDSDMCENENNYRRIC